MKITDFLFSVTASAGALTYAVGANAQSINSDSAADSNISMVQIQQGGEKACFTFSTFRFSDNPGSSSKYPEGSKGEDETRCISLSSPEDIFAILNGQVPLKVTLDTSGLETKIEALKKAIESLDTTALPAQTTALTDQLQTTEAALIAKLDALEGAGGGSVFPVPKVTFQSTVTQKLRAVDFGWQNGLHTICAYNAKDQNQWLYVIPYLGDTPGKLKKMRPNPYVTTGPDTRACVSVLASSVSIDPLRGGTGRQGPIKENEIETYRTGGTMNPALERGQIDVEITSLVVPADRTVRAIND